MELTPPDVPLTDGKIVLRLREPKDRPLVSAASQDPETQRWLEDEPIPVSGVHAFRDPRETWAQGERAPFVIADPATDRALGLVSLRVVADGTGSVAVSVFPEGRGQGIGPAALRLIARWAIAESGFQRVEAEADVANTASRRMIEKAGFVREGILRDHCETHGVRHDCEMFALVQVDLTGTPVQIPSAGPVFRNDA
jgi:RimJ/RimL family protein N-acetyltransferase